MALDPTNLDDAALIAALRRRMLDELERRDDIKPIVNNIYGHGVGGLMGEAYQGDPENRDDYDYFVDIMRKDLEDKDPETGKPLGWEKKVHRYRSPKKKVTQGPIVEEPSLQD